MSFAPYYPSTCRLAYAPEAASQTFVQGNLVYLDGDGCLAECASDPTEVAGVAAEKGSNGAANAKETAYWAADMGAVFVAKSNTTTSQTQCGVTYGTVLSSSEHLVDISETGTLVVYVSKLDPRDAVGKSGGRYLLTFTSIAAQGTL